MGLRSPVIVATLAALLAVSGCGGGSFTGRTAASTTTSSAASPRPPRSSGPPYRHPPVVVLMFDEFETAALFDAANRIDPVRFPNFAALARTATVYRRFTAEGDITGPATGSLLSSRPYVVGRRGFLADFPENIFVRFRRAGYALAVRESATNLCPRCRGDRAPRDAQDVLAGLHDGRIARFRSWLGGLRPSARPTLHFEHLLLPHNPLVYSPSGHVYRVGRFEPMPGADGEGKFTDPWLVRQGQQRYLMQIEAVDTLVGQLVDRLKAAGLWDRAVVVLTADNGEAWGDLGSDPHRIDPRTMAQIVQTPLMLKLPGQHRGGYSDKRIRAIDLLPTLGRLAHVPTPGVAGRSFLGPGAGRIPAGPIVAYGDQHRRYSFTPRRFTDALRRTVRAQIDAFGQHTRDLSRIDPERELLGRPVDEVPHRAPSRDRVTIANRELFHDVSLAHDVVPSHIVGRLRGPHVRPGRPFAVAVNGRIAATGYTARPRGSKTTWVSAMVPESSLREGRNVVRVYLILGSGLAAVPAG